MKNQKSFTLIELLVVISVIGLLSSVVLVSFKGTNEKARISKALEFSQSVNHALGAEAAGIWTFDEGSGATVKDSSGNGNDGMLYGNTVFSSDTPSSQVIANNQGKSLFFDGNGDYVRIPKEIKFETIHGPNTLELWFKTKTLSSQTLFSDNCMEWGIFINNGIIYGKAYVEVGGGQISIDKWYHVVLTHEHPNGLTNTLIRIYINGQMKEQKIYTISNNGYNDTPYGIGYDPYSGCGHNYYFNGFIDDVRIYGQALIASEIQKHYAEELGKYLSFGK